jgi:hypothetical protein
MDLEEIRISNSAAVKKYHADSGVSTAHFLKRAVMIKLTD